MAKQSRSSGKRSSAAKGSGSRPAGASRAVKASLSRRPKGLSTKTRQALVAGVNIVMSKPSKASMLGRKAERAFIAGVNRELRNAAAHGIAVTIQGDDGQLVRGVPMRSGGAYVVHNDAAISTRKVGKVAKPGSRQGRRAS